MLIKVKSESLLAEVRIFDLMINRNALTVGLMISSILLLILLEGLWLYRSYEKEWVDLRRDASIHLRTTLNDLRDSVMFRNVRPFIGDTAVADGGRIDVSDTMFHHSVTRVETSVHAIGDESSRQSNVRVFITTPSDSLQSDIVKPLMERLTQLNLPQDQDRTFVVRVTQDTVSRALLADRYGKVLAQHDIKLPVIINVIAGQEERKLGSIRARRIEFFRRQQPQNTTASILTDTLTTDIALYNPLLQYSASLAGTRLFLVRAIAPEIFFVVLLTTLTCGAFFLVYRNLRNQQQLVRAKDEFISNITHELKTPVATVSVALEALRNFNAMENRELAAEYLEIALKELGRLSKITDNILRISVLENNSPSISKEKIDLSEIAEKVAGSLKLQAESKGGEISLCYKGEDFAITGSVDHITNAITNLVDNAIKYSPESPHIRINVNGNAETVAVSVKDQGIGIDTEFHEKIFEKFFRVPRGNIHTVKGHGLGLNYVKFVTAVHQGKVNVQSEPGKGSEFTLTFPRSTR